MSRRRGRSARGPVAGRWHWFDGIVLVLAAGIAYASLAHRGSMDCSLALQRFLREGAVLSGSDALGNLFAYLLLGAALGVAWRLRRPDPGWTAALLAIGFCALLSASMEAAQACMPTRVSAWWDLAFNTVGGALGWFGVRLLRPVWAAIDRSGVGHHTQSRLLAVALLAAVAWLTAETAPWVPSSDVAVLAQNVRAALRSLGTSHLDPWRLAARLGQWLALGLLLSLPLRRPLLAVLPFGALAAAALGLRLALQGTPPPSPELVVALPVAALALLALPRLGTRTCAALAIGAASFAMAAYELAPGYGMTQPFRWRVLLLQGDPIAGIQLAAYFGWYAMTMVAAGHVLTGRALAWVPVPVALLAAAEWAQTTLPGRTADLSPPLIALAVGALAAGMLAGARARRR